MVDSDAERRYVNLVHEHGRLAQRIAVLITGEEQVAHDVVHDVLIELAAKSPRHEAHAAAVVLVRRIVRRSMQAARRQRPAARTTNDLAGAFTLAADAAFATRLAVLPLRQRAVLVLRYHTALDDRSIARALRCSLTTVLNEGYRALAVLRAHELQSAGAGRAPSSQMLRALRSPSRWALAAPVPLPDVFVESEPRSLR
jgi:DNA-directed RNA polymerase specialized sigma24 family protein